MKKIDVLQWPPNIPNLTPVENLWGKMSRDIYRNGAQYTCVDDIKRAILRAWESISKDLLLKLASTMKDSLYQLIASSGKSLPF